MPTTELATLLDKRQPELGRLSQSLLDGNAEEFTATMTQLLTSLATGIPVLGVLAKQGVAKAFSLSSNAALRRELAALEREEERQAFADQISGPLEELIGQALIQLVNVQNRGTTEVIDALGGLRTEFEAFRGEFAEGLREATVVVDLIDVSEGVGVRVSARTTRTVKAGTIKVTKGTGIVLD